MVFGQPVMSWWSPHGLVFWDLRVLLLVSRWCPGGHPSRGRLSGRGCSGAFLPLFGDLCPALALSSALRFGSAQLFEADADVRAREGLEECT